MDWFDSYYTLLVDNYEEFAEQKNDDDDDDEKTTLMRKNAKEKNLLCRVLLIKKEKHVHCASRKQQHASIVLTREMKWTQTSKKKNKGKKRSS